MVRLGSPVAVPGVRRADKAAALHTDRGHSLRSLDSATGGAPIAPLCVNAIPIKKAALWRLFFCYD